VHRYLDGGALGGASDEHAVHAHREGAVLGAVVADEAAGALEAHRVEEVGAALDEMLGQGGGEGADAGVGERRIVEGDVDLGRIDWREQIADGGDERVELRRPDDMRVAMAIEGAAQERSSTSTRLVADGTSPAASE
jgi:hypothetical protein